MSKIAFGAYIFIYSLLAAVLLTTDNRLLSN